MGVKLNTASGGSVSIEPTNTASNYTLTVPAQTGTVIASDSSGNVGIGAASSGARLYLKTASGNCQLQLDNSSFVNTVQTYGSSYGAASSGDLLLYGNGGNAITLMADNASGTIKFATGAGGTERMRIDSSGRVTIPYQPMMYASSSGGTYSGAANPLTLSSNLLNVGSNYNTGTGRFTAPIAGRYQAIFTGLKQGSGGSDYIIRKNGTAIISAYASGEVATFATHLVIELAANDYITFSAGGNWYTDYISYSVQLVS